MAWCFVTFGTMPSFFTVQFTVCNDLANGHCQLKIACNGDKLSWGEWHADHIVPHSKGGKTTVANGQAACPACNLVKSNKT